MHIYVCDIVLICIISIPYYLYKVYACEIKSIVIILYRKTKTFLQNYIANPITLRRYEKHVIPLPSGS